MYKNRGGRNVHGRALCKAQERSKEAGAMGKSMRAEASARGASHMLLVSKPYPKGSMNYLKIGVKLTWTWLCLELHEGEVIVTASSGG